VAKQLSRKNNC